MPQIDYHAPLKVLVAVRGHPFDRNAFDGLFAGMSGISATMVDQPAAALLINPQGMADFDALVLYDMPGLDFAASENPPASVAPPEALRQGLPALLRQGKGVVALHHALAGWPGWAEYHDWLGGQFLYRGGAAGGGQWPCSGYRHDVTHEVEVLANHPVTAGLPPRFTLTDELYLCPVWAEAQGATPLLRSHAPFTTDHFWSAELAVAGRMFCRDGWQHPPGSGLVGWARQVEAAKLVYLQPGDGPETYANPHYRQLVENAIRWVAQR